MIQRELEVQVRRMASQFKAVAITGPRQSGKTTLARKAFPAKPYISLEAPDERLRASRDPRQFLARFPEGAILDEVQRVPELFSWLQGHLDENASPGQFILTGSQQFGVLQEVSQTLAGRVAVLHLLPLSQQELQASGHGPTSVDEAIFQGGYPPLYDPGIDAVPWLDSYLATYVERDVRLIVNVQDTALFQRFLALAAGNTGQLLNQSRMGSDCGVSHRTVAQWFSVLEASFVAFRLQPHHRNFRKRLVKTPKLYFWDTGLACRLLGIESSRQLATHPLRGNLFENWVVVELAKARLHQGRRTNLFFWRNNTGLEVDILIERGNHLQPVEIKSGATIASDWTESLAHWLRLSGDFAEDPTLIYGGETGWEENGVAYIPWRQAGLINEGKGGKS